MRLRRCQPHASLRPSECRPLDEVAHLATAALGLLVLARFIDVPGRFYGAALIASVAIDLDHIPYYLGLLTGLNQRPITHSLATVAVFTGAAAASRRHRAVLAGTAAGLLLHFARDIVEGPPGVRMLWPLQKTAWIANYWWFLGMIILFAGAPLVLVSLGVPHARWRAFRSGREHLTVTGQLAQAPRGTPDGTAIPVIPSRDAGSTGAQ